MSRTPDQKSPEETFRDRMDARGELSYERQREIADNAQNNLDTDQSRDGDNDDPPPPLNTILIY